jgi:uncharacterized protein YndB with AHSA1/START domain
MQAQSVTHSTFVIERSYPATPPRVFAAFSDPAKKRRWFAEGEGFDIEEFKMDFRVGGIESVSFRAKNGVVYTNNTTYQDILPDRRIVIAYTMGSAEARISASLSTFEFLPAEKGTDLVFTEQAAFFEGADGPQMREDGWRKLLEQLALELARQ